MIVVDDVLGFPIKSLMFLLREIHKAAKEELAGESDAIRRELSDLYLELEAGRVTDEEFDDRERTLLDRLDSLEDQGDEDADAEGEDEQGSEEGDGDVTEDGGHDASPG